jgi:ribulose-5-phosphate 4-epimerase/fuculose-1-phosphate aldolase
MKPRERECLIVAARRMYESGLVTGALGAVGVRLTSGEIAVTALGSRLGFLEAADLVLLDENGLAATDASRPPDRDSGMLFAVLSAQPEAGSVIRIHSPYATALAHRGRGTVERSKELLDQLGGVSFVPYFRPGTAGLAGAVAEALRETRVAIREGQGPVVWGTDIEDAVDRAEALEAAAQVAFLLNGGGPEDTR